MRQEAILIRHGETSWNEEMRYQGQTDISLNERGKKQALVLAKILKEKKISNIYSSDLKRAYTTAHTIAKYHKLNVEKFRELREINYGEWEGMLLSDVKKKYGEELERWWKNPDSIRIPGGETLKEFRDRVKGCFKKILKENFNKTFVIVSHGGPIRIIISEAIGLSSSKIRNLRIDNSSINILESYREDFALKLLNETCHLKNI